MTTSPAPSESSQESGDENDKGDRPSKTAAGKDRECPYCHQKFTSSSLGRHLDQFLSKKKPDGIHNVYEIRRLRGGITRRTARNSQKKDQEDAGSTAHSPSLQYTLPSYSELLTKTAPVPNDVRFNRPHWQASGVITDPASLNPPSATAPSPSLASPSLHAPAPGQKRSFSMYAADAANTANSETTRALELSLREVLDAIRIATDKAAPPTRPFEFAFESYTFPYFCLALLPIPPTLFESTPFGTSNTIPLSSPGHDQYQTLRKAVSRRIEEWKWTCLSDLQRNNPPGSSISEELDQINDSAQTFLQSYLAHLDAAYHNFMSYPAESRFNLWMVEVLRAWNSEQTKVKESNAQVERMTQEVNRLQHQLDHLSRCQWPREMALWPPERPSFDSATRDELRRINLLRGQDSLSLSHADTLEDRQRSLDRWDYDRLVSKWKRHVREDRARKSGPPQPGQSPPGNGADLHSPSSNSAPRIPSSLNRTATVPDHYQPCVTHTPNSRPTSALAMPTSTTVGVTGDRPFDPLHTPHLDSESSGPLPSALNGTSNGATPDSIVPGPPRRRIGILSDVDEHYGPRLAGLRRER